MNAEPVRLHPAIAAIRRSSRRRRTWRRWGWRVGFLVVVALVVGVW